jgi:hypothetical protein
MSKIKKFLNVAVQIVETDVSVCERRPTTTFSKSAPDDVTNASDAVESLLMLGRDIWSKSDNSPVTDLSVLKGRRFSSGDLLLSQDEKGVVTYYQVGFCLYFSHWKETNLPNIRMDVRFLGLMVLHKRTSVQKIRMLGRLVSTHPYFPFEIYVCLFVSPSICPCVFDHLSLYTSVCSSVHLSICMRCPFVILVIILSACLSLHLSVCLSVCFCVCLSICLCLHLSV